MVIKNKAREILKDQRNLRKHDDQMSWSVLDGILEWKENMKQNPESLKKVETLINNNISIVVQSL